MVLYNEVASKMENNNKESFKLLDVTSSGSASESVVPEVVLNPRKKKLRRRTRGARPGQTRQTQGCRCKGQMVGMIFATVLLLCWLLVLTWLAVVLNAELSKLDGTVKEVVAGNQNVPAELQECHSLTRHLQQNQTELYNQIIALARQLGNFSSKLIDVQDGFHNVQEKLDGAPELVNVPQTIKDLQGSVAVFGSQIRDLTATVDDLKSQSTSYQELSKNIVQNLTSVRESVNTLLNSSHHPDVSSFDSNSEKKLIQETVDHISRNLSQINDTLSKKLEWVAEDQKADRNRIADLEDKNLNVRARVTTLEGECTKMISQEVFNTTVTNITDLVSNSEKEIHNLNARLSQMQLQGSELSSNNSRLAKAVEALQQTILPLLDVPASTSPTENIVTDQSVPP